jgi:hypothetical protein
LEVAVESLRPLRILIKDDASVSEREKIAPNRGRSYFVARRLRDPSSELFRNEGPDAMQLSERPLGGDQVACEFRPQKGTPGGAPKCAH